MSMSFHSQHIQGFHKTEGVMLIKLTPERLHTYGVSTAVTATALTRHNMQVVGCKNRNNAFIRAVKTNNAFIRPTQHTPSLEVPFHLLHRLAIKSIHRWAFLSSHRKIPPCRNTGLFSNYRFPGRALKKAFQKRNGFKHVTMKGWARLWHWKLLQQQHCCCGQLLTGGSAATTGPRAHLALLSSVSQCFIGIGSQKKG